MSRRVPLCLLAFILASCSTAQVPPTADQIGGAVLAAPEESRPGATVFGYEKPGQVIKLREGDNEFVCLADDPEAEGFSVACYHKDLEPYMARGRELRAQGVGFEQNLATREAEVADGTLFWPKEPRTLYVLSGPEGSFDPATNSAPGSALRYVVYVAYATSESTGLSEAPGPPGTPWLMAGGTFRAHIMVIPPATQ